MTPAGSGAGSSRLPPDEDDLVDGGRRAIVEDIRSARGRLPTPFRVWVASPELARLLHPLGRFLARHTSLSAAEREIVVLCAARRWDAGYVLGVHAREAREAGLDPATVTALLEGRVPEPADARQRAVVELMAASAREGVPDEEVFGAAVAHLGHRGVAEVLATAGYFTAVGLAMKVYAVEAGS